MKDLIISPKSCYVPAKGKKKDGFLACKTCYGPLNRKKAAYPFFGINNNWLFGTAPPVLTRLNEQELACISLVKNVAHIFSYFGGQGKKLRVGIVWFKLM